jgi:hypothetical protein
MYYDDFKLWKVDVLLKYCQERGVSSAFKHKDELVALPHASYPLSFEGLRWYLSPLLDRQQIS